MSYHDQDKLLEQALQRFDRIHALHTQHSTLLSQRLNCLDRTTFLGLGLVLAALFFLVVVMYLQMNNLKAVTTTMHDHLGSMNQDMDAILGAVGVIERFAARGLAQTVDT
jgi:fructose-specific phosphotransferase system IIC component